MQLHLTHANPAGISNRAGSGRQELPADLPRVEQLNNSLRVRPCQGHDRGDRSGYMDYKLFSQWTKGGNSFSQDWLRNQDQLK